MQHKIAIYVGTGSSHSWLWFVDVFEKASLYDLTFLDESEIHTSSLHHFDCLIVSGGDTFSIAQALGPRGAYLIHSFVDQGGTYIGSCAGAYLPMNSSKPHLNLFNFVPIKIANLSKFLPQAHQMQHKFYVCYGCQYLFHPVRDEVRLKNLQLPSLDALSFTAPLYGGPSMIPSQDCQVLASYEGFTEKTAFLVDRELARRTLDHKAAIVRVPYGKGEFYLFGPHVEHPGYPIANKILFDILALKKDLKLSSEWKRQTPPVFKTRQLLTSLKRELSNSRIIAVGLETNPMHWIIGEKSYEPAKIRVFLEAIWKRLASLEKHDSLLVDQREAESLIASCLLATRLLKLLKKNINNNQESYRLAKDVFSNLKYMSQLFFTIYFRTLHFSQKNTIMLQSGEEIESTQYT